MAWGLCLRSNISFLRSRMFSVSAFCCGVSKVMKSARATFDLLESGRKKAESSSVVATMSIRTLPLSPATVARPVAKTLP